MPAVPHREPPYRLARWVQRTLPWVAVSAAVAGMLITALSGVPERLPGIALSSTPLFLVERGGAVVASLIVVTGLVGRTLGRELPTGFSATTGSLTYTEKVESAASSSDTIAADLIARLDEQEEVLAEQGERLEELAQRTVAIAALVTSKQPSDPPGR
jgi:hypothetical protein